MAPPTARDALIAELLGDVGLLHDDVKLLRQSIPSTIHSAAHEAVQLALADMKLGVDAELARLRSRLVLAAACAALVGGLVGAGLALKFIDSTSSELVATTQRNSK